MDKEDKESVNYEIPVEIQQRLNIFKILLTIMVIFIHSYIETIRVGSGDVLLEIPIWFENFKFIISKCISRIAVPAFFLISSILLYKKEFSYKDNLIKKLKTLVVPYLILNTFWILFYFVVQMIPSLGVYFSNEDNIIEKWNILDFLNAYLRFL